MKDIQVGITKTTDETITSSRKKRARTGNNEGDEPGNARIVLILSTYDTAMNIQDTQGILLEEKDIPDYAKQYLENKAGHNYISENSTSDEDALIREWITKISNDKSTNSFFNSCYHDGTQLGYTNPSEAIPTKLYALHVEL